MSGRADPHQALLAINRALASGIGSNRVFAAIVEGAREAFSAERGVLLLGNEPVAFVGGDAPEWSRSVVEWVRNHREPLLSVDAPDDPRFEKSRSVFQGNVRSVMAAPLHVDGDVEGVIYLAAQQRLRDFGENDLRVLAAFADQAALTFKLAALKRELERRTQETEALTKLAELDALTGLLNRRAFDRTLDAALTMRPGPLALILLDIDLFKNFNDRYGHPTGDDLLRAAARMLEREVRATKHSDADIVARVGGEEFALLLTDTGPVAARQVAERVRSRFTKLHETSEIPLPTAATASFGIACAPFHGSDPETLIKSADRALYRAKEGGRNRVEAAMPGDGPLFEGA